MMHDADQVLAQRISRKRNNPNANVNKQNHQNLRISYRLRYILTYWECMHLVDLPLFLKREKLL